MRTKEAYLREPADDREDDSEGTSEEAAQEFLVVSSDSGVSSAPVLRKSETTRAPSTFGIR